MSRITKMKYVTAETKFDYTLPSPHQTICVIVRPLGNNTHMVRTPEGEEFIVSMPPKFRRHVYVKRGSFVVTEPIVEGKKVKAEIVRILQRNQIKYFNDHGAWPDAFSGTVYLDNKHVLSEDTSDRGFVHGDNILMVDVPANSKTSRQLPVKSASSNHSNQLEAEAVRKQSSSPPKSVSIAIESSASETPDCCSSDSSDGAETDSDTGDDESDLVPNFNRKAVSRFVFSDDGDTTSSSEDEENDDGESSDESSDDEEEEEKKEEDKRNIQEMLK